MEPWMVIIAAVVIIIYAHIFAASMGEAQTRRRAWNLWTAGIIDDAELKRRLGE